MIEELSIGTVFLLFALAGGVVLISGTRMSIAADQLADRTGLGEAVIGGVVLGASTSLSGSIVSLTAALDGHASLAFSNGIGGIAVQTAFLALADLLYRRANLEHAAAELANVFQAALLILMLSIPFVAFASPEFTIWSIHPASLVLLVLYIAGLRVAGRIRARPMWRPVKTLETREDLPADDDEARKSSMRLIFKLVGLLIVLSAAGWVIARCGIVIVDKIGVSATVVGALMTATATSLPELVTTIAAVRRGALQLAVGGIIGGNTFDTLFLTLSDIGYREGSLYHSVSTQDLFWLAIGLLMTAVLLIGLILREKRGPANIGVESVSIMIIYCLSVLMQTWLG